MAAAGGSWQRCSLEEYQGETIVMEALHLAFIVAQSLAIVAVNNNDNVRSFFFWLGFAFSELSTQTFLPT